MTGLPYPPVINPLHQVHHAQKHLGQGDCVCYLINLRHSVPHSFP